MAGAVCSLSPARRDFISNGAGLLSSCANVFSSLALDDSSAVADDAATFISWDGPPWSESRYGASTLQSSATSRAPPSDFPVSYPDWLGGYHAITYKFVGASFPQGRRGGMPSLRTAGAGLGTCASLPNVGYAPPAPHALHYYTERCDDDADADGEQRVVAYEDLAYNVPRVFEAFWPQAKVLSVRTNGGRGEVNGEEGGLLLPRCYVSGDGCRPDTNPGLHSPASRIAIEFDGPTRRGGRLTQSSDITLLRGSCVRIEDDMCRVTKCFSQYNSNQDLQTFYREITSLRRIGSNGVTIDGRIRVQAFLPFEAVEKVTQRAYDDTKAVAIYEYLIFMEGIDATEAASI